jgi:hypothetical protein
MARHSKLWSVSLLVTLGDLAAAEQDWRAAPNLSAGSLRYRSAFSNMCAPGSRKLPFYLDSGAYRESVKTAPTWSSYAWYCQAIDLI